MWPYPRAGTGTTGTGISGDSGSSDDVVELDFADTRALSDPDAFMQKAKEKQQARVASGNGSTNGNKHSDASTNGALNTNGKKKTRKERAAERSEREREEIERGWDDPVRGEPVRIEPVPHQPALTASVSASAAVNGTAKDKQVSISNVINGTGAHASSSAPASASASVDGQLAKEAVLATVLKHPSKPGEGIPRNVFVRELLTLIHVSLPCCVLLFIDL